MLRSWKPDIMPIDNLIGFAGSEQGAAYFGADTALVLWLMPKR